MSRRGKGGDAEQQGRRESSRPGRTESQVRNLRPRSRSGTRPAQREAITPEQAKAMALVATQELGLPGRATDVLEGILLRQGNQEIADRLRRSRHTIATHVRTLLRCFGVTNRFDLAAAVKELNARASLNG
jgi:DNA-binding NarL/FixJ family response regulator